MNKAMKVTLGGDRIGSGNKMKQRMRNFDRASFDISKIWASSVAPGVLYPCFCDIGTIGTTYEMKINDLIRTIPTNGPLFGSFEARVEVYFYPLRLTQGILHNNPLALGLNAKNVLLPMANVELTNIARYNKYIEDGGNMPPQHATAGVSSLINYLGAQSLPLDYSPNNDASVKMQIAAGPILAYYDAIKNYHLNKQEENAYVIGGVHNSFGVQKITINGGANVSGFVDWKQNTAGSQSATPEQVEIMTLVPSTQFKIETYIPLNSFAVTLAAANKAGDGPQVTTTLTESDGVFSIINRKQEVGEKKLTKYIYTFDCATLNNTWGTWVKQNLKPDADNTPIKILAIYQADWAIKEASYWGMNLIPFPITNLDDARYAILDCNQLNKRITIDSRESEASATSINWLPYALNVERNPATGISRNTDSMNGLMVKCYKSDLFNNWLNSEWIDGSTGINELSAIPVQDGKVLVPDLILHKKVYTMMNRVVINDGTYHGYQEALWGESSWKNVESAVYMGGMSSEVVFEEVVSSSAGSIDGTEEPLGTLGGRGKTIGQKGGVIKVRVDEAGYILAIFSITPRVFYDCACKFYMTDIKSFADLHTPNLDNLGFQNLPTRYMAGWDGDMNKTYSAGKQPSWIQYQTNYNTSHGDFAMESKAGWMVLNRDYDAVIDENTREYRIGDLTTYIDPTKYNKAFADVALEAQNFWVQLKFDVIARRKMSANQIPNL